MFDSTSNRLLYAASYAAPYNAREFNFFIPASDLGLSDAQLQAHIKKTQAHDPPVVFNKSFRGDPSLDRGRPIPVRVVLNEVEQDDSGDNGEIVDDYGGQEDVREDDEDEAAGGDGDDDDWAGAGRGTRSSNRNDLIRRVSNVAARVRGASNSQTVAQRMKRVAQGVGAASS